MTGKGSKVTRGKRGRAVAGNDAGAEENSARWRNRIVGHGRVAVSAILANPFNFRVHDDEQAGALEQVIDDVGFVRSVTVNRRTGHLVDGHLRVKLAVQRGEKEIPVEYVELSTKEEQAVIAALDPLSTMATVDQAALDALVAELDDGFEASRRLLEELSSDSNTKEIRVKKGVKVKIGPYSFQVPDRTFKAWAKQLGDDEAAVKEIRRRLKLD